VDGLVTQGAVDGEKGGVCMRNDVNLKKERKGIEETLWGEKYGLKG